MSAATAITSLNQVPALHKFVATLNVSVFDFGAGKKGKIDTFYANQKHPRVYLPFDPYNRTKEENAKSWRYLENEGVDVVTCANVLNVLDDSDLVNAIWNLAAATRQTFKGLCFISVYHKPSMPRKVKRDGYIQRNQPLKEYIPFLEKEFDIVSKVGQFLVCKAKF